MTGGRVQQCCGEAFALFATLGRTKEKGITPPIYPLNEGRISGRKTIQPGSPSTDTQAEPGAEIPPVGEALFYLVSYNDGQDSRYGSDTAMKPRVKTGGGCE